VLGGEELKRIVLEKVHNTRYLVHSEGTKSYKGIGQYFCWYIIKKKVAEHLDKHLACQKLKAEHQYPVCERWPLEIPTWK